jgi:hypothetical protein
MAPLGGASVVLTVNRQAVLTADLTAPTDGTPAGFTISATANQSFVTAS